MEVKDWLEEGAKGTKVTTEDLDNYAKAYMDKYREYENAKAISTALYKEAEELEGKLVEAMEQAGKRKYFVEGLGTFSFRDKMSVQTPKTAADKTLLFNYIREHYGNAFLTDKLSIASATLNKLYNEAVEEYNATQNPEPFAMPGLNAPTNMRSLAFTKEK